MSFASLERDALYRTAVEDFGADVGKNAKKEEILAALLEDGVTWNDYLKAHPEAVPEEPEVPANVVTSEAMKSAPPAQVLTRPEPVNTAQDAMYLIKMERDNPYFEYRGYKFTQEHPYVVMGARDADRILKDEEGFVIASPTEASEYYA